MTKMTASASATGPRSPDGELLRLILESAIDFAIISTSLDGRITTWNEGARRIFGYEESEAVGQFAHIIFTPGDIAAGLPEKEMAQALAEGRAEDERWHRRKDDSQFWASGQMMPLRQEDGTTRGFLKILRDRTAERQAGEAAKGSEQRFLTLIENLPHKVWFMLNQDATPFVNRGWREYTGFTPEEGRRWTELVHPEDFPNHMALRDTAVAAGEPYELRTRIRGVDGIYRWQLARMVPLKNERGEIFAWLGSWTDIDDIVRTETALGEAALRQSMLAREASHRVKNSLQLVASLLNLQARSASGPEIRSALKDAVARIAAVAQIHDRLWRTEESTDIDLAAFLEGLCDDLRHNAPGCSLSFTASSAVTPTELALPLGLVVNELVTNAFKYACGGGRGEVRVTLAWIGPRTLLLTIADDGPGLPEGVTPSGGGSLGMRLVTSFSRQLGASLETRSTPQGTCFKLQIPVPDSKKAAGIPS